MMLAHDIKETKYEVRQLKEGSPPHTAHTSESIEIGGNSFADDICVELV